MYARRRMAVTVAVSAGAHGSVLVADHRVFRGLGYLVDFVRFANLGRVQLFVSFPASYRRLKKHTERDEQSIYNTE